MKKIFYVLMIVFALVYLSACAQINLIISDMEQSSGGPRLTE